MTTIYIIAALAVVLLIVVGVAIYFARKLGKREGLQLPIEDALHDEEKRKGKSAKERAQSDSAWIGKRKRK
jgi:nitrogen fixation-related uncharacterized protein